MSLEGNRLAELTVIFWLTSLTKGVALVLGAFIVYLAFRGYKRNASRPLLYVSLGFGLITTGTVIEGLLYTFFGYELLVAVGAGTVVTTLGFVAIIYSIYSSK
jgi:branched-subunit amino acid ABC-type transport system permease component